MTLEIANATDSVVHVALYKRSLLRPAEPAVAWAIVSPPPRGRAIFSIPKGYRVLARYSFSPEDPWQPVYQTNALSLQRNHDSFVLREITLGRSALGAVLARNVKKAGLGELRIENHFMIGAWCHVQLGEHDVHLPRLLPPRGVLTESLISPFFLAVVNPRTRVGAPLLEEEVRATEIELETVKGGVFTVRFNPRRGYRITQGAPIPAELVEKPKKASRAPERKPKAQGSSKAAPKKRGAAKKPVKKPTSRRKPDKTTAVQPSPVKVNTKNRASSPPV
jgi:hypothetical protein